ncbi:hypothetical protein pb186bvf_000609 [Paramecium bursaria]
MSRKLERLELPLTDRSHVRKISQKSLIPDETLDRTLHQRINSLVDLDEQLKQKLKQLGQSQLSSRELISISTSLQDLVSTLQRVSFEEIMLNNTTRENQRINKEMLSSKTHIDKLQSQIFRLQIEYQQLQEKYKQAELEIQNLQKQLQQQKKINHEQAKKLQKSEQRVQIILDSNITMQKDQLKISMIEALQENEQFKKNALQKERDLQKLTQQNNQLNQKIQRLNNRFSNMGKQINEEEYIDQEKMVITFTEIPQSFVFRYVFLNTECKQFIQTTLEYQTEEFMAQILQVPQELRKQQILWLFNQFTSYKEFSYGHNQMFTELIQLIQVTDFRQLSIAIAGLQTFLKVTKVKLWLRDFSTGFFVNYQSEDESKIICSKGAFKDCLESKEAINKLTVHKNMMYQNSTGEDIYQDLTYIYPILTDTVQPAGLLEFYHPLSSNQNSDIQYYASIIGNYLKIIVDRIEDQQNLNRTITIKDIVVNQFFQLIRSSDKLQFSINMREMQAKVMQISTSELVFVENNKMWKYVEMEQIRQVDQITGLCGDVAKNKSAAFFQNISKEVNFNQIIDLYSIIPVYIYPIVHQNQTVGVIQLTLTNKQINRFRFKEPLISLEQKCNEAQMFVEAQNFINKISDQIISQIHNQIAICYENTSFKLYYNFFYQFEKNMAQQSTIRNTFLDKKLLGTLFEEEEITKKDNFHNQIARDDKGHKRFHGAFEGGFQAGYNNTVGSKEGWAPQKFVSSINNRGLYFNLSLAKPQRQAIENYMDQEDLGKQKLGVNITIDSKFDSIGLNDSSFLKSQLGGAFAPDELVYNKNTSVGYQILQTLKRKTIQPQKLQNDINEEETVSFQFDQQLLRQNNLNYHGFGYKQMSNEVPNPLEQIFINAIKKINNTTQDEFDEEKRKNDNRIRMDGKGVQEVDNEEYLREIEDTFEDIPRKQIKQDVQPTFNFVKGPPIQCQLKDSLKYKIEIPKGYDPYHRVQGTQKTIQQTLKPNSQTQDEQIQQLKQEIKKEDQSNFQRKKFVKATQQDFQNTSKDQIHQEKLQNEPKTLQQTMREETYKKFAQIKSAGGIISDLNINSQDLIEFEKQYYLQYGRLIKADEPPKAIVQKIELPPVNPLFSRRSQKRWVPNDKVCKRIGVTQPYTRDEQEVINIQVIREEMKQPNMATDTNRDFLRMDKKVFVSGGVYVENQDLPANNNLKFDPTQLGLPISFKSNSFERNQKERIVQINNQEQAQNKTEKKQRRSDKYNEDEQPAIPERINDESLFSFIFGDG